MKKFLILILALLFPVVAFSATPTITNVTGTLTSGQTLTISGSNMVQEDKTGWDPLYTSGTAYGFEGTGPVPDGYQMGGGNAWDPTYTTAHKVIGAKSLSAHGEGANNEPSGPASQIYTISGDEPEVWVRFYIKFDVMGGTIPTNYMKILTTMGSGGMYYLDVNSEGWFGTWPVPGVGNTRYEFGTAPQEDRWYMVELHWKYSTPRLYEAYIDGELLLSGTNIDTSDYWYLMIGMINWEGTTSVFNMNTYYDGLVSGQSRVYAASTIEISGDGTTWKYQEPIYLSETSSQIKLDLSGLTGTNYRVRVKNNRQEVSSSYFLSGEGGTPIPGSCGDANGQSFVSLDATNPTLCDDGSAFAFTVGSSYTWGCSGVDGGASTSSTACTASISSVPAVFGEDFQDGNFATRGWYDNTTHGTIVSGGQTGNCLQWAWTEGENQPTNGGALRRAFTPTDSLYVSFYVKFGTGWQGSQQTYHPHIITIPSDLDDPYAALANNYLNTYIEFLSDVGSPYAVRPSLALQDSLRVNSSLGTPPLDLSAVTENRSVTHCNTPAPEGGVGICYNTPPWYSANLWPDSTPSISINEWHLVETYFKMNDVVGGVGLNNGVMQQWVDGTQIVNRGNILYRTGQDPTKKWAQFVLSPWIGDGSPITQTMWIDELVVATDAPAAPGVSGSSFSGVLNGIIQ